MTSFRFKATTLIAFLLCILLFQHQSVSATATAAKMDVLHRSRNRPLFKLQHIPSYQKLKNDNLNDFFVDDDDLFELSKRQTSDDYGHLRFGKRDETFDDYGHMRFGRSEK